MKLLYKRWQIFRAAVRLAWRAAFWEVRAENLMNIESWTVDLRIRPTLMKEPPALLRVK